MKPSNDIVAEYSSFAIVSPSFGVRTAMLDSLRAAARALAA
jgi:hypothetical protein